MKFEILWIEDKPTSVDSQKKEIEKYLKEEGFEGEITFVSDVEKIENDLDTKLTSDIDIIVTDNNIKDDGNGDSFSGKDVLEKVKNKDFMTDILFYSVKNFNISENRGIYNFVEFVEKKQEIVQKLKLLINKNIKKYRDIYFLRGFVISKVIDLELKINEFFGKYLKIHSDSEIDFHDLIMENAGFHLFGKQKAISKILKSNKEIFGEVKIISMIQKIGEERNLLAHSKVHPEDKNKLIKMGAEEIFDKNRLKELMKKIDETSQEVDKLISNLDKSKVLKSKDKK
jgi:hypothetical protein